MPGGRTCRRGPLVPWIQQGGQLGAAAGDARPDGAGRDPQAVGDLRVVQITQDAQHHRDAKLLGQAGQRIVDCQAVGERFDGGAGPGADVSRVGGVEILGKARGGAPLPSPQLVEACVGGDAVGPGGEGGSAVEAPDAACDRDQSVLGGV